ncbi:hypothetical protein V8O11_20355 [Erwinia aphidicola]|uniref:phage tail fiber protein n=1 Tax=Erwinia aphidicola TaxID=68334 RepID=UPI00300C0135
MPAGTIALTNNSATVGGTGTAFTTELKAGDFIGVTVGGAPYTMIVASIASNTQLTIAQAYNGPTASGLAWYGVPATLKYAITQQVLNDMATNQRGMIAQLANWQKIYSDAASVTVERPDRSTFTGPSWGYMAAQYANKAAKGANSDITSLTGLTTALSVAQGGTGGKTAAEARSGLGLGSAATYNVTTTPIFDPSLIPTLGAIGLGAPREIGNFSDTTLIGFGRYTASTLNRPDNAGGVGIQILADGTPSSSWFVWSNTGAAYIQTNHAQGGNYSWKKVYTTANTTTNSSGALVPASPIVRIVNSRESCSRAEILGVDGAEYNWATVRSLYNEEAKGVTVSRRGEGEYLVKGAVGLAKDLWSVMDCGNGQGRIIALAEAEETSEGIVVRCYKQRFTLSEDGELSEVRGPLIDIPDDTWIDVRLEMPEDSAWNTRMREMEQAAEVEEQTS